MSKSDKHLTELARRVVACQGWRWLAGAATRTTHDGGGCPPIPAGTVLRAEEDDEDFSSDISEGRFGPLTEHVRWSHPNADEICAKADADYEAASLRVLPVLTDSMCEWRPSNYF